MSPPSAYTLSSHGWAGPEATGLLECGPSEVPTCTQHACQPSSWAWGSMGAVGTGVLAAAEGVESVDSLGLEGLERSPLICRDKREEVGSGLGTSCLSTGTVRSTLSHGVCVDK